MTSPTLDDDPGLLERVEDFTVQKLVAQLRVEALAIAVLPWAAWHDVGRLHIDRDGLVAQRLGDELGTIVSPLPDVKIKNLLHFHFVSPLVVGPLKETRAGLTDGG